MKCNKSLHGEVKDKAAVYVRNEQKFSAQKIPTEYLLAKCVNQVDFAHLIVLFHFFRVENSLLILCVLRFYIYFTYFSVDFQYILFIILSCHSFYPLFKCLEKATTLL